MTTRGAAYEIRFCKDNIVQVFDLSKKSEFNEQKLPYEYDEDDVVHGRLRYSKLLAGQASSPLRLADHQEPLPLRKLTRPPQEILLQVESKDNGIASPPSAVYNTRSTWSLGSLSSSSSTCYTKNTPVDAHADSTLHEHSMPIISPLPHIYKRQKNNNKSFSKPDSMVQRQKSSSIHGTTTTTHNSSPNIGQHDQYQSSINLPKPTVHPTVYRDQFPEAEQLPPPIETHADMRARYEMEEKREAATAAGCCCIIC